MMNTGLTDTSVYSLWINGTDLYASVGSGGVWKRPLSELVTEVSSATDEVPLAVELRQNYPNPFNPTTIISCRLPLAGDVKLTVFDILGREVAQLVNGRLEAGRHEVAFDASGLPTGTYFCTLEAAGLAQTRKMLLLK